MGCKLKKCPKTRRAQTRLFTTLEGKFYKSLTRVVIASCKKQFLHKTSKGVEIAKWQRKRCTRQFALTVERNAKSPSSLTQADQFTAESVGPREEIREEGSKSS